MSEKDILGYCPINNKIWYRNEVKIPATHIAEQLSSRRYLCSPEPPDLNSLRIALVTNKGVIEGLSDRYDRIIQDHRVTVFTYHLPIVMETNLYILETSLLTPGNRLITSVKMNSKIVLLENEIYRPDHYFYIY